MTFWSILFDGAEQNSTAETREAPECLGDLNLDQVIEAITAGKEEYDLKPFFYTTLHGKGTIEYRHEVMRELENKALFEGIGAFAQAMRTRREYMGLAERLGNRYQRERWFLEAADIYCTAVTRLDEKLAGADLRSRGLLGLREYVRGYASSERLRTLMAETQKVKAVLATVRYCLAIKDNTIKVRRYEGEVDYSAEVEHTFERFKEGAGGKTRDYRATFASAPEMNHVEYQILNLVALLFVDEFRALDEYWARNRGYLDAVIGRFEREVQFYVATLEFMAIFRRRGLAICYPQVVETRKGSLLTTEALTWRWRTSCACRMVRSCATTSTCRARNGSLSCRAPTREARRPLRVALGRCTTWPGWAARCRGEKRSSFCATKSTRILRRKKTSRT